MKANQTELDRWLNAWTMRRLKWRVDKDNEGHNVSNTLKEEGSLFSSQYSRAIIRHSLNVTIADTSNYFSRTNKGGQETIMEAFTNFCN
jgi:hypothetical protein